MVSQSLTEPTQQEAVRPSGEVGLEEHCNPLSSARQKHPIMPELILGLGQGELGLITTAVKHLENPT